MKHTYTMSRHLSQQNPLPQDRRATTARRGIKMRVTITSPCSWLPSPSCVYKCLCIVWASSVPRNVLTVYGVTVFSFSRRLPLQHAPSHWQAADRRYLDLALYTSLRSPRFQSSTEPEALAVRYKMRPATKVDQIMYPAVLLITDYRLIRSTLRTDPHKGGRGFAPALITPS